MRWLIAIAACTACGSKGAGDIDASTGGGDDGGGSGSDAAIVDAPPDNGPRTVRLTLLDRPGDPSQFEFLVAYQDGDGAWTAVPTPAGDTYSFTVATGRYGYAWTCHQQGQIIGGANDIHLVKLGFYTTSEHTHVIEQVPAGCAGDKQASAFLSGSVANRGNTGGRFFIQWGDFTGGVEVVSGGYGFNVQPGTHDLVVAHSITGSGGTATDSIVDSAVIQRNVTVTAAGLNRDVDFATSKKAQLFSATIVAGQNAKASTATTLVTASGTTLPMVRDAQPGFETGSLAAAQMLPTDVYEQTMTVAGQVQTLSTSTATATPAAITFVAPAPLGAVTASVAATMPYPQLAAAWQPYPNAVGYQWNAVQQPGNTLCIGFQQCLVIWSADLGATAGASGTFQMPDLSGVAGWAEGFQPVTGVQVVGDARASTSSAGPIDFPFQPPAPGTARANVRSAWATTP